MKMTSTQVVKMSVTCIRNLVSVNQKLDKLSSGQQPLGFRPKSDIYPFVIHVDRFIWTQLFKRAKSFFASNKLAYNGQDDNLHRTGSIEKRQLVLIHRAAYSFFKQLVPD